jgi:DNA-binding transcriptional ArsR family regulator
VSRVHATLLLCNTWVVSTRSFADEEQVSRTFAALADPTRRAILRRLTSGEATITKLAEPFALTQQAISQHVKVLEEAGLVERSRVAQTRPCRLKPGSLEGASAWIDEQQQLWAGRHQRLAEHLATLAPTRRKRPDT